MRTVLVILLSSVMALSLIGTANSANFAVEDTADAVDAKPGDGKCATAAGRCTLRAAVQEANALDGTDSIDIASGNYKITIAPSGIPGDATGAFDLTDHVNISGDGPGSTVVDGGAISRVFYVPARPRDPLNVDLSDLSVANGNGSEGESGGGVWNGGNLKLGNVALVRNQVSMDGRQAGGQGGGLFSTGTAALTHCKVDANIAEDDGGGIVNDGGTLNLLSVTVTHNQSRTGKGGGIVNRGKGTVVVSTIDSNTAEEEGGGLENAGDLTVASSLFSANEANSGGGIRNMGTLSLANVTLSGNQSKTVGGGLANQGSGKAALNNVTITANDAKSDAAGGGVFNAAGASVRAANTIIAANQAPGAPDCSGQLDSAGYNLVQSDEGCEITGVSTQNILAKAAALAPLAANGGPTKTHALQPGSPAIDAANPATPADGDAACQPADQRGASRPADGNGDGNAVCDIGAYERK